MKKAVLCLLIASFVLTLAACRPKETAPSEPPLSETESSAVSEQTESIDLTAINLLRPDYDLGTCRSLCGDVSVVLFWMDDFESEWFSDEIADYVENEVRPALDFLEQEAKKYGVELHFDIRDQFADLYYDDDVIVSTKETGLATIDVLDQAARRLGYADDAELLTALKAKYQTEIVCLTVFDKNGTAYAINPTRGETREVEEHCILFTSDLYPTGNEPIGAQASIVAHEMLHLFGAEDYYATESRKAIARRYYPNDLMLGANYNILTNRIGDATAFYIGWTDEVPEVLGREDW